MTTEPPADDSQVFAPHPLRAMLLAEVHARPFHPVPSPRRILHFAFVTDAVQTVAARRALHDYCAARGVEGPHEGLKHFRITLGGAVLRWESHAEFTTYTWELAHQSERPFEPAASLLASAMTGLPQPGPLLACIDLDLIATQADADLARLFDPASLVASRMEAGAAIVAMDFRADPAGFVRILVQDRGLGPNRAGALVQRLLEIETYRLLTLLGLPEAHALTPKIHGIETRLTDVARQMTRTSGLEGNHALLDDLTGLLAELEAHSANWPFRFGATRAYDGIVQQRLLAINEQPYDSWPSIAAFLQRRVAPALRTTMMLDARLETLSRKLVRAANLLRTRVDVEIEQQNRDLLRSMNERTRMQLRLQQTVEGLSIAAISYYIVGLAAYTFKGLKEAGLLSVSPELATAAVVPLALLVVALIVTRLRSRHDNRS